MLNTKRFNFLFIGLFLLVFSIYIFNLKPFPSKFISFTKLAWENNHSCESNIISELDDSSLVLNIGESSDKNKESACLSKSFTTDSNILKFNYYISGENYTTERGHYILEVFHDNNLINTTDLLYDVRFDYPDWRTVYVELPEWLTNKEIYFNVKGSGLQVRSRLNFISKTPTPLMFSPNGNFKPSLPESLPLSILLGMILFFIIKQPNLSNKTYGMLLFSGILLSFFSLKTFFYYDEWTVINGFKSIGANYILSTHNEHFLPIFFSWYYLLINTFKSSYTIIQFFNFIFHLIHALLLLKVSKVFGFEKNLARILVFLYSISALHIEVIEWAFEQSIILSSICTLLAILSLKNYVEKSSVKSLLSYSILLFSAPLIFGNGFTALPISFSLIFLHALIFDFKSLRTKLIKFFISFGLGVFSCLLALFIYSLGKEPSEAELSMSEKLVVLQDNAEYIWNYILVGTGAGSILRGLGLYPYLGLDSLYWLFELYFPSIARRLKFLIISDYSFELSVSIITYRVLFVLSLIMIIFRRSKLFIFGLITSLIFLLFSLLLPSLVRYNFGELQSLALRYQYQGLIGLFFLMLSFITYFKETNFKFLSNKLKPTLILALFIWIFIQTTLSATYNYFRYQGEQNRLYVGSLKNWDTLKRLEKLEYRKQIAPIHNHQNSPGLSAREIYEVAVWLEGN